MSTTEDLWNEMIVDQSIRSIEAALAAFSEKIADIDKACRESKAAARRAFANNSALVDRVYRGEVEQAQRERLKSIEMAAAGEDPAGILACDGPYYERVRIACCISQDSYAELALGRDAAITAAKNVRHEAIEAARRHLIAVIRREIADAIRNATAAAFEPRGE